MAEHPGFNLKKTEGRAIVRLRVRPDGALSATEAMQLPKQALQWREGSPTAYWLGPDQWLLSSERESVADILTRIDDALSDRLYAAVDMSSALVCLSLSGQACRVILAMGCGIDMHPDSFPTGSCARTRFAQVPVFMVATGSLQFDLYVDRSYSHYLCEWLSAAGEDPITHPQPMGVLG